MKFDRRTWLEAAAAGALLACTRTEELGPFIAPSVLASRLGEIQGGTLAVLFVGPTNLFKLARIPGARDLGPIETARGKAALGQAFGELPPTTEIVLYCGCCPVKTCPNIRPASRAIRESGRKNVSWLDLPRYFGLDWRDMGYPVEKG